MSTKRFVRRAIEIHGTKYGYSQVNYKNNCTKVDILCLTHGIFAQRPTCHLSGRGCRQCAIQNQTASPVEFIRKANVVHENRYDYSNTIYRNVSEKVEIICSKHGSFWQRANAHLTGKGCSGCLRNTLDDFLSKAKAVHKDRYDYSKVSYKSSRESVEIICRKHGMFSQRADAHLAGQDCKRCSNQISKAETQWLNYLNMPQRYRQAKLNCGGSKRRLTVDAYDPATNTVYEFYGDIWHGNPRKYPPDLPHAISSKFGTYGDLYARTMSREARIREAGFNLIAIWEDEWAAIRKNLQLL
jgi:hypothetical protein